MKVERAIEILVDVGRHLGADGWVLEGWYLAQDAVTHWMPLPEPPKEGGFL